MINTYIKTHGYGLPDHFEYHEDTLFKIHNKLLYACISGAHDMSVEVDNKNYSIEGFRANKFSTGYVLLCKIVESALQIKRPPQYQNRIQAILSSSSRSYSNKQYKKLENSTAFTQACTNFLEVYRYVQEQLNKNFPPEIKTVRLKRFIAGSRARSGGVNIPDDTKYSELIVKLYSSAKLLELPTITIPMDFINSYTQANENSNDGLIALHQDIPFQDILYSYQLISQLPGYSNSETTCISYSEENEWVVMNLSPTEMTSIPVQNVECLDKDFELRHQITSIEKAQAFMLQYEDSVKYNKLDFHNVKLESSQTSFWQKIIAAVRLS